MLKITSKPLLTIALVSTMAFSNCLLMGCATEHHQESTGQYIDGSVITARVKAKLIADKTVKAFPITVNTYKNIVQLSGFVNTPAEKERAEVLARSVPDVADVDNALIVKKY